MVSRYADSCGGGLALNLWLHSALTLAKGNNGLGDCGVVRSRDSHDIRRKLYIVYVDEEKWKEIPRVNESATHKT